MSITNDIMITICRAVTTLHVYYEHPLTHFAQFCYKVIKHGLIAGNSLLQFEFQLPQFWRENLPIFSMYKSYKIILYVPYINRVQLITEMHWNNATKKFKMTIQTLMFMAKCYITL